MCRHGWTRNCGSMNRRWYRHMVGMDRMAMMAGVAVMAWIIEGS